MKKIGMVVLSLLLVVSLFGCSQITPEKLWESATYTSNKALGEGAKSLHIKVVAGEQNVLFTLHTDAENVAAALEEVDLLVCEEVDGVKQMVTVNGMTLERKKNKPYWALMHNSEVVEEAVNEVHISDGISYSIVYTEPTK